MSREPDALIQGYLDAVLDPADLDRLDALVRTDRAVARRLAAAIRLHHRLQSALAGGDEALRDHGTSISARIDRAEAEHLRHRSRGLRRGDASPSPSRALERRRGDGSRRRWLPAWAALLVVGALLATWWVLAPGAADYTVVAVTGGATADGRPVTSGPLPGPRTTLRVPAGGSLVLRHADRAIDLALDGDTEVILDRSGTGSVHLQHGRLRCDLAGQPAPIVFSTARLDCRIVGTAFTLASSQRLCRLEVTAGAVACRSGPDGRKHLVRAGQGLAADGVEVHRYDLRPDERFDPHGFGVFFAEAAAVYRGGTWLCDAGLQAGAPLGELRGDDLNACIVNTTAGPPPTALTPGRDLVVDLAAAGIDERGGILELTFSPMRVGKGPRRIGMLFTSRDGSFREFRDRPHPDVSPERDSEDPGAFTVSQASPQPLRCRILVIPVGRWPDGRPLFELASSLEEIPGGLRRIGVGLPDRLRCEIEGLTTRLVRCRSWLPGALPGGDGQ